MKKGVCAVCAETRWLNRGLCSRHYREARAADAFVPRNAPIEQRLWTQVDKAGPGGCWLWKGRLNNAGYGRIGHRYTHRLAYELIVGAIPDGLHLDHLCRVRSCCNPVHLEPVTMRENLARGERGVRVGVPRSECSKGHPLVRKDDGRRTQCRRCANEAARIYRARRVAEDPEFAARRVQQARDAKRRARERRRQALDEESS